MSLTKHKMSGVEKAGVLLLSLGADTSAKVFDCLSSTERDLLGAQIIKLRQVDDITRKRVLDEVNLIIKSGSLPKETFPAPTPALNSDEPLRWLESLDPSHVADILSTERPQNIALVLAHLSPQGAAAIMSELSDNLRNQVALRLAAMKPVSKEAVEAVDEAMRTRLSGGGTAPSNGRGLLNIIGNATERVRESVAGTIHRTEPATVASFNRLFESPDDLAQLTDSEMRTVFAKVDSSDLGLAMRVAGEDLRAAVLRNVPEEVGAAVRAEMTSAAQIRVREIEAAQSKIMELSRSLFAAPAPEVEAVVEQYH